MTRVYAGWRRRDGYGRVRSKYEGMEAAVGVVFTHFDGRLCTDGCDFNEVTSLKFNVGEAERLLTRTNEGWNLNCLIRQFNYSCRLQ